MANNEIQRVDTLLIDGFPLPHAGFEEKTVREVLAANFLPGDVVLSTYPKSGTTWAQFIIWGIVHDGEVPPDTNVLMLKEFPFLEITGLSALERLRKPRLIKLHLPYKITPKCPDAKYISVMRNAFDCCTSYYNHLNQIDAKITGNTLNFDNHIKEFVAGTVPFGDYFETVQSWYERKDDANVLFMTYEDMKTDHRKAILTIADFLGSEISDKLRDNPEILDNILKHSGFKYMKECKPFRVAKDLDALKTMGEKYSKYMTDPEKYNDDNLFMTPNFYREGAVGGGKNELSPEQWQMVDKAIDQKVKYPELRQMMRKTKI